MLRKTIHLPAKLWTALDDAAEHYGVSVAEYVRIILNNWFLGQTPKKK